MARRKLPSGVVRVLERRRSGAAGPHAGRTRTRGSTKRAAIRASQEE